MQTKVSIDQMASAIMEGLQEYADLATDDLKQSVKKAGKTVKDEIAQTAPKDTGKYAKSWTVKTVKETSNTLDVVVHSRTATSSHTFWNTVMLSEAAEEWRQDRILLRQRRKPSKPWKEKWKRHWEAE